MNTNIVLDLLRENTDLANKIQFAVDQKEYWLNRHVPGIYDEAYSLIIAVCAESRGAAFNEDEKFILRLADDAERLAKKARYYDDCFAPTLPVSGTRVLGHEYRVTEYICTISGMLSKGLRMLAGHVTANGR